MQYLKSKCTLKFICTASVLGTQETFQNCSSEIRQKYRMSSLKRKACSQQ